MTHEQMVKNVKLLYNCCDKRANTIILEAISEGKRTELEIKLLKFIKFRR